MELDHERRVAEVWGFWNWKKDYERPVLGRDSPVEATARTIEAF